jgi:orotidine-5'-phosphate decarboxylase
MSSSPFIIAFDYADQAAAARLADQLSPALCRAKVGKELFTATGMAVVDMLHAKGYEIFLDLKYHDIPNTVAKAVSVAASAGVWMVNVHASGGERMMTAAKEAVITANAATHLIAVTVLTSMAQQDLAALGITRSVEEQVLFLAGQAQQAGLDGVVCSAQEAAQLKSQIPLTTGEQEFLLVTPGIRPADAAADDQRRTLTPQQALAAGSNYLVVGRPVTQADDPRAALQALIASLHV